MFKSKYSATLTVILIILIVAIIVIGLIVGIRAYNNVQEKKENNKVYAELTNKYVEKKEEDKEEEPNNIYSGNATLPTVDTGNNDNNNENNQNNNTGTSSNGTSNRKAILYQNYPVAGYIKISKTNVNYPILTDVSPSALDKAVGIMYQNNSGLNEPGNVVIIGHNYRNGKFFSNNKKLVVGDKIQIIDLTGRTVSYTIYEIFQTSDTDTAYITRDRGNNTEISLSTCTDDGKARLIILARAEQ